MLAVSMQCVNVLKKRSLEAGVEPWSCRAKRVCLGVELQVTECPMETTFTTPNQQQEQQMVMNDIRGVAMVACDRVVQVVQTRPAVLCCPRCLGGEPGHINHIMRP